MRKLTLDDFVNRASITHNNKYDYSKSVYIGSNIKIDIICPIHGLFQQQPGVHLLGQGCNKCKTVNRTKTLEQFIFQANSKHGNRYDYNSALYKKDNIPITILCNVHGKFNQTPNSHLNGSGCPMCYSTNRGQTSSTEEFVHKAKVVHGQKYDYSCSVYTKAQNKLKIACNVHGIFTQKANSHLNGQGCPVCGGAQKLTQSEFIQQANARHDHKYSYNNTIYLTDSDQVYITCNIHGDFAQTPNNHKRGTGCPWCKQSSKGEQLIERWLISNQITFKKQYKFDECISKRKLPFDFFLPDYNTLIEFNGIQHYAYVPYIHKNINRFNSQVSRDEIKQQFAKHHHIPLLIISYKNINKINTILQETLHI